MTKEKIMLKYYYILNLRRSLISVELLAIIVTLSPLRRHFDQIWLYYIILKTLTFTVIFSGISFVYCISMHS